VFIETKENNMSKHKKSKRENNQRKLYIFGAIGVFVAVIGLLTLGGGATAAEVVANISPASYQADFVENNAEHILIDVRTPEEFNSGHISGAINIPVESLQSRINEVPTGEKIIVYCRSGNRSAQASQILSDEGYTGIYDLGGIINWTSQGYPVE